MRVPIVSMSSPSSAAIFILPFLERESFSRRSRKSVPEVAGGGQDPATTFGFPLGGSDMADKIRLGLIGASVRGTWSARSHLPAIQTSSDVELTAVCTTRADSAEAARQTWGARLAFDDWRKMVTSPEIDAVAVVVRVPSHYEPTKAALEAGKHVYCEWPLGQTTAEAEELARLAEAKGLTTAVGLQARANPALMYMREEV